MHIEKHKFKPIHTPIQACIYGNQKVRSIGKANLMRSNAKAQIYTLTSIRKHFETVSEVCTGRSKWQGMETDRLIYTSLKN
jgi:hypothetical protein